MNVPKGKVIIETDHWEWLVPEELANRVEDGASGFSCGTDDGEKCLFVSSYVLDDSEASKENRIDSIDAHLAESLRKPLGSDVTIFCHRRFEKDGYLMLELGGYSASKCFGIFIKVITDGRLMFRASIHHYYTSTLEEFQEFASRLANEIRPKQQAW